MARRAMLVLALLGAACSDDGLPFERTLVVHTRLGGTGAIVLLGDGTQGRTTVDDAGDARFEHAMGEGPVDVTVVETTLLNGTTPLPVPFTFLGLTGDEIWLPLASDPFDGTASVAGRTRGVSPSVTNVRVACSRCWPPFTDVARDGAFDFHGISGGSQDLVLVAFASVSGTETIGAARAAVGEGAVDLPLDIRFDRTIRVNLDGFYAPTSMEADVDFSLGGPSLGWVGSGDNTTAAGEVRFPSSAATLAALGITMRIRGVYSHGEIGWGAAAWRDIAPGETSARITFMRPPDIFPSGDCVIAVAASPFRVSWASDAQANRVAIEMGCGDGIWWRIVGPPTGQWQDFALPSSPSLPRGPCSVRVTSSRIVGIARFDESYQHPPKDDWSSDDAERLQLFELQ